MASSSAARFLLMTSCGLAWGALASCASFLGDEEPLSSSPDASTANQVPDANATRIDGNGPTQDASADASLEPPDASDASADPCSEVASELLIDFGERSGGSTWLYDAGTLYAIQVDGLTYATKPFTALDRCTLHVSIPIYAIRGTATRAELVELRWTDNADAFFGMAIQTAEAPQLRFTTGAPCVTEGCSAPLSDTFAYFEAPRRLDLEIRSNGVAVKVDGQPVETPFFSANSANVLVSVGMRATGSATIEFGPIETRRGP